MLAAPQVHGKLDRLEIVDTNVHLGRWPFRRLPLDHEDKLANKLTSLGFTQAWACSFDALLHRDMRAVNTRITKACVGTLFAPIGAINPRLPDWQEDLRICGERHKMRGVRVYPNYHGYSLSSPEFLELLATAGKHGLLVQITVAMEDPRTQHPSVRVGDVDLAPLVGAMKRCPAANIQLLNFRPRAGDISRLANPNLYFDTARVDSTDGVPTLYKAAPQTTLFGTHAPLLIPEAATIRVHESGLLDSVQLKAIYGANSQSLLTKLTRRVEN